MSDGTDEIEARVRNDIDQHGWHIVLIPPEEPAPGWAHTIGLFERFEHPELLTFGIDLQVLAGLLNHLGAAIHRGARFGAGDEPVGLLERGALAFRDIRPKWQELFLGNAAWHYKRPDVPALQCFWPDPGGHLPWQPECDAAWRGDQPLLYEATTQAAIPEPLIESLRREGAL